MNPLQPHQPVDGQTTVLLVDDQPEVLASVQLMLKHCGYAVLTALSGAAALALVQEQQGQIGVVVTDLMMPEMDGRETICRLREVDPHLPFIAISGNASPEDIASLYALGVVEFLAKPFSGGDLCRALVKALALRRQSLAAAGLGK